VLYDAANFFQVLTLPFHEGGILARCDHFARDSLWEAEPAVHTQLVAEWEAAEAEEQV